MGTPKVRKLKPDSSSALPVFLSSSSGSLYPVPKRKTECQTPCLRSKTPSFTRHQVPLILRPQHLSSPSALPIFATTVAQAEALLSWMPAALHHAPSVTYLFAAWQFESSLEMTVLTTLLPA